MHNRRLIDSLVSTGLAQHTKLSCVEIFIGKYLKCLNFIFIIILSCNIGCPHLSAEKPPNKAPLAMPTANPK